MHVDCSICLTRFTPTRVLPQTTYNGVNVPLYFRGYRNVQAVMQSLVGLGFGSAETVIVSGDSAVGALVPVRLLGPSRPSAAGAVGSPSAPVAGLGSVAQGGLGTIYHADKVASYAPKALVSACDTRCCRHHVFLRRRRLVVGVAAAYLLMWCC